LDAKRERGGEKRCGWDTPKKEKGGRGETEEVAERKGQSVQG